MLLFRIARAIGMVGYLIAALFGLFVAEPATVLIVAIERSGPWAVVWVVGSSLPCVAAVLHRSAVVFALNHVPTRHRRCASPAFNWLGKRAHHVAGRGLH